MEKKEQHHFANSNYGTVTVLFPCFFSPVHSLKLAVRPVKIGLSTPKRKRLSPKRTPFSGANSLLVSGVGNDKKHPFSNIDLTLRYEKIPRGCIWMFPKIVVPPNHPFLEGFLYKSSILGYPLLLETPIYNPPFSGKFSKQPCLRWRFFFWRHFGHGGGKVGELPGAGDGG